MCYKYQQIIIKCIFIMNQFGHTNIFLNKIWTYKY